MSATIAEMQFDPILVAVVVAAALLPLLLVARRRMPFFWRGVAVLGWLGISAIYALVTGSAVPHAPAPVTDRPVEVAGDGYVTSKTCRACHPGEHASWHASFHRTMTQVATPETVIPEVPEEPLAMHYAGEQFQVFRRGDELWAEMPDDSADKPGQRTERQIVMTTGSHHMQAFWVPTGESRKLALFPICYNIGEQRWMPIDAAFLAPPEMRQTASAGRWNVTCHRCHATGAEPRLRSHDEMDTRAAEFGISCEACHGPGADHVRKHRAPLRRYREHFDSSPDDTIVNPARLPPQQSAEACGQCHGVSVVRSDQFQEWREHGFRFRPGLDLEDGRVVVTADKTGHPQLQSLLESDPHFMDSRFWSDGMVRVSGREFNGLIESPCFQHGDPAHTMTCLSCHSMHRPATDTRPLAEWTDDQLKPGMRTNQACTQCHAEMRDPAALARHTFHDPASSGSNCYNCHMSYTTYGLLKAIRSHTVDSPSVQASIDTGRPNACNQCHLDKTMGWAADHLHERYQIPRPQLTPDQDSVAASILWAVKGDAGQRALMAWSMGWEPAREASGEDWMIPYLALLMMDDYHANRFIAYRSLRRHAGFEGLEFDFMSGPQSRTQAANRILQRWSARPAGEPRTTGSHLLIDPSGNLYQPTLNRLAGERDRRPVFLNE